MKIIEIHKAQPVTRREVEDILIEIIAEVPTLANLEEMGAFYQQQAEKLCDALLASLPQGTSDRLLAELLKRKASYFVFPQEGRKER